MPQRAFRQPRFGSSYGLFWGLSARTVELPMNVARLVRISLAFLAGAMTLSLTNCGKPAAQCSPATCSGCCGESGCQTAPSRAECGKAGNACVACPAGANCEFGICKAATTGGGSGGASGGAGGSTGGGGGSATGGGGGTATGGGAATGGGGGMTGGGGGGSPTDGGFPIVPLTFMANCGSVAACPGNEVGSWVYSGGCIDDSALSSLPSFLNQLGCSATVPERRGTVSGGASFDGTTLRHAMVGEVRFKLAARGMLCVVNCGTLSNYLPPGIQGTCAVVGQACECALSIDISRRSVHPYTYDGGVLTTQAPPHTYDTCISGSTMRYRETTDGGIPGVYQLSK